ncbi:MAG: BatA domain-containing protein [Acidobacteria bacterium]|nr:BatA domain-containing protein [Acidobacteriota bacterium]
MAFLNPLFLLGALAAAVPILLHLVRRADARKMDFPTLMFLRKIDKKTIRYQKLRRLLLLLLRVAALLLLVLAFMRPYREGAPVSAAGAGRRAGAHIIALDNSMSMGYRDRWERAQSAAADIVRRSGEGDTFAVVEFSGGTRIRTQLTGDKSAALEGIKNIAEPGSRPTRYVQALKAAEKIALESGAAKRVIHLISDFQRNGWTDEERGFKLKPGIELQPVDLGSDEFSNLAIDNVRTTETDQGGASSLDIRASVVEYGERERSGVRVGLVADGRAISEKTVRVPGKGAEEIEFQVPGLGPGGHSLVLEIDDPSLERDNRFYMTLEVRGKTPVIAVENPGTPGRRAPGFFLVRALNVDRLSPYQVTVATPRDLDIAAKLLIWNDVPVVAAGLGKRLEEFVRGGGGMILVLGNATGASEFNRGFGAWLPVLLDGTESVGRRPGSGRPEDFVLMTDIRTDHPVFQPFGKPHSGTFSGARFYSHAGILPGPGAEVLARFDNGDPALVSAGIGKGRVLIFASSADDTGNDLPLEPVYAPFWQQMLRYLESFGEQRNWIEIGDAIDPGRVLSEKALRLGNAAPEPGEAVAVLDPDRQRLETAPDSPVVVAEKTGFYDIRTKDLAAAVAVNTVPAESDLAHASAEEMAAAWVGSLPGVSPESEQPAAGEKDRRGRIWIFFFLAALLFLVSELHLANSGLKAKGGEVGKAT